MNINFINSNYRRFFWHHPLAISWAVLKCLATGEMTLRQEVWDLEKNIAKFVGTKYAVGVNSGTDALFLSLLALGIGKGDSVITVSNTFIATIQAIVQTGAEPILIDVGKDELMNMDLVEAAIKPNTKAIIPVEYTGSVVFLEKLKHLAVKHKFYIVDDACQALGAKSGSYGQRVGTFGILNCFSFNTAKLLGGLCDGGMVTTDDRALYEKLCLLRNHWNVHQLSVDRHDYPQPDTMHWAWKSRLSNVNAAFLNVKFKTIDFIINQRQAIAERYNQAFEPIRGLITPHHQGGRIWQEYHLRVENRDQLAQFLKERGIETLTRDTVPNHKMPGLGLEHWQLPVTEQLAKEVIRLPLHEWLTDKEVAYIIQLVREFYGK